MHMITITEGMGSCVICEDCWGETTPEERLDFYMIKYHINYPQNPHFQCEAWERGRQLVKTAVLNAP